MTGISNQYYPNDYKDWLFRALELEEGDELEPSLLDHLYMLNKTWVHAGEIVDYDEERELTRAYTLYYMTINMPKLWFILDHATAVPRSVRQLVEYGCGPGTFLWAYLFYLARKQPDALSELKSVKGVDRSPTGLDHARKFASIIKEQPEFAHIDFEFVEGDWQDHLDIEADVAIFGNVLNEDQSASCKLDGVKCPHAIIIEPGTRTVFHGRLLDVRQRLSDRGYSVMFPCPASSAPCPMADDENNWCHFAINRFSLPFIQKISNKAHRLNPRHNFSGFLFSHTPTSTSGNDWRCLSRLKKVKRSGIRWLCNGCEMKETILNRHSRADGNRPFLDADWGDLLTIKPELSESRLKPFHKVSVTAEEPS